MVGCSLGASRLWFTIGGGILNEVYHPRVDIPQIRDMGFLIGDGEGFWVEVKRMERHVLELGSPGCPAVRVIHRHDRFELVLRIVPCMQRDVLLVEVTLEGDDTLRPYVLLAPHLGGTGMENRVEVAQHRGRRVLWAEQGPFALALAAFTPRQRDAFGRASAGYVGFSDGWQDFSRNGAMTWEYPSAGPGNVAVMGELPRTCVLALAFGSSTESAATLAFSALFEPFEISWERQITAWTQWLTNCMARSSVPPDLPALCRDQFRLSAMVLRAHQDKTYLGAMVASLSIPWGNTRAEHEGYHLVWPRDLVECAGALLAVGATREAGNTLRYLLATQQDDGRWNQNQWLGGKSYWSGVQLDEVALPVVLATTLDRNGALDGMEVADMIQRALSFIVCNGPSSDQDRWEEDAGINTFTLAACVAALVAGAPYLPSGAREFALAIADYWNARLEDWTTVRDTPLSRHYGIPGYYVRVAPREAVNDRGALDRTLPIKNWALDPDLPAAAQIGLEFLQLVRFGLRRAEDPLIVASVQLVDAVLKVDTPNGPCWHRYNDDGYGEHDDGTAYDGTGRGRAWPLLTGERGHYEICRGGDALPYILAMARMACQGGMLPEQVWDAEAIPERALALGRATGAAMPLAWAHAEFIKLVTSYALQRPFDRPDAVWDRYGGVRPRVTRAIWCPHAPVSELPEGCPLTLALTQAGVFHIGFDGWMNIRDVHTSPSGLGLHVAAVDTALLQAGQWIDFTYRQEGAADWIGRNFRMQVVPREPA